MLAKVPVLPRRGKERGALQDRDAVAVAAGGAAMSENEKEIIAINGAARAQGISYGQFVSRATEEEIREAIRRHWPGERKRKKSRRRPGG